MPTFSKLRSLTPRGSRRRRISAEEVEEPLPQDRDSHSQAGSISSGRSGQLSSEASVNLYTNPEIHTTRAHKLEGPHPNSSRPQPAPPSDSTADPSTFNSTARTNNGQETDATSISNLPPLQARGVSTEFAYLAPVLEDDPASYLLVAPTKSLTQPAAYSLEDRGETIFAPHHLEAIFDEPAQLLKFTEFLTEHRPKSVPLLIYYLDALKALTAIRYANAIKDALEPLPGHEFSHQMPGETQNLDLEAKAREAFHILAREDLPAFVTHKWIQVVSVSINNRVTGTMPPHLREMSEGLAEVFCLTDPSREDNPIVLASEEFYRTTQYGVSYAIGRNCRFLQGPRTNRDAIRRIKEALAAGRDHCETFVNYRRDGSPFMNLLMLAPLRDARGTLRYFIGAQVDVSGLAKECTNLEALQTMLSNQSEDLDGQALVEKEEFEQLSQMFNQAELNIVRKAGGRMHQEHAKDGEENNTSTPWHRPRLLLKNPSDEEDIKVKASTAEKSQEGPSQLHGKLVGVYSHYLLVRPYPSLRILFASPSLRMPGMLQSPFMNRIGSSERVREELISALAEGRGVTAKIRWVGKHEDEGRNRWIHCTPLLGGDGNVGVWMVVLVDDDSSKLVRRFKQPPVVAENIGKNDLDSRRVKHSSFGSIHRMSQDRLGYANDRSATPPDFGRHAAQRASNDSFGL